MTFNKRPLALTIVGSIYIAVGTVGFAYHLKEFDARHAFQYDVIWIELTELLAIVSGGFILRGQNWARLAGARLDGIPRDFEYL